MNTLFSFCTLRITRKSKRYLKEEKIEEKIGEAENHPWAVSGSFFPSAIIGHLLIAISTQNQSIHSVAPAYLFRSHTKVNETALHVAPEMQENSHACVLRASNAPGWKLFLRLIWGDMRAMGQTRNVIYHFWAIIIISNVCSCHPRRPPRVNICRRSNCIGILRGGRVEGSCSHSWGGVLPWFTLTCPPWL